MAGRENPKMGSDLDPKQKYVMGYPSMDRYHPQAQNVVVYPQPPPPAPIYHHPPPPPPPYISPSFHHHHHQAYAGGGASSFHNQSKFISPASKNPYSPSFNEYYFQQQQQPYNPLVLDKDSSSSTSFSRVILILMMILVSCMCMMSLVMWFLFGTTIPEFEVVSLKVSNLTATNTTVTGIWDAGLTIKNSNEDLTISISSIRSSIFYKEAMLGISNEKPLDIPKRMMVGMNTTVDARTSLGLDKSHEWVAESLEEDRVNYGVVAFSLRMAMNVNFTSSSLVYRQESLRVLCENLHVDVSPDGQGTLKPGINFCLIRIRDTLE